MKRVLFVDDESRVLEGLRRMLRGLRYDWDMEFVSNGEEALARLAACPFDVVVSDMRMPGMDGCQLLERVRQKSPTTVRIILSGHSDRRAVMRTVGVAHQFLSKPCDSEVITATVSRACRAQDQLSDPWHRQLVCCVASVPSPVLAHAQLVAELESAEPSVERVGEIVSRDVGMTAKLLQLVSSSFFGSPQGSADPARWTGMLGIDTLRPLVLKEGIVRSLDADGAPPCSIEDLAAHSRQVARCAKALTEFETADAAQSEQAYLAGLLHDIGLFLLAERVPERLAAAWTGSRSGDARAWEIERADAGVTHADIGGYLLALWGAPEALVEATVLHHTPALSSATTFAVLTAVHVADAAADAADAGVAVNPERIDMEHLRRIGCAERLARWCELCQTVAAAEALS
jgi:HD-like signal output (HDOD) protein/CheY-like chemotaxis protein